MPARAKALRLPLALRAELDKRLIRSVFSGYQVLSDWLADQGFPIGKSSLGRYGLALERERRAGFVGVESTLQGRLRAGKLRIQSGTIVTILDPVTRKNRVYSLPGVSGDDAWEQIEQALLHKP